MTWALGSLELGLMAWFLVVGWEAFMQRAYGVRSPFNLFEFHHAYLGAALVAIGWHLRSPVIMLAGLVLTLDDLAQHLVHTYGDDPDCRSPLHHVFAWTLWRVPGVPAVTRFLDAWWGAIAAIAALVLIIARAS